MPRNGKEGILFSFIMSAIMIYVMAALNYGVRIGDVGAAAWSYALFNWPLAYVVGMICDLCICTPSSRAASAIGSTPRRARTSPVSESSPRKAALSRSASS